MRYSELLQRAEEYATAGLIVEALRLLTVIKADMTRIYDYLDVTDPIYAPCREYNEQVLEVIRIQLKEVDKRTEELRKAL